MKKQAPFLPLLESISRENERFIFPIQSIRQELISMFMNKDEFDYFLIQSYNKLKREYGFAIANIFLMTIDHYVKTDDIHNLDFNEYSKTINTLIDTLENIKITRVEKDSPDGEILSAMH